MVNPTIPFVAIRTGMVDTARFREFGANSHVLPISTQTSDQPEGSE
jgi:hypothetical protein